MNRKWAGLATVGLFAFVPFVLAENCKECATIAKSGEGFCAHCGHGKFFGINITSKDLFGVLAGTPVDAAKTQCEGCKTAIEANGVCKKCGVGIANGKAYKSMFAYKLAKGLPAQPSMVEGKDACPGCKAAFKDNGFCTSCNAGFVSGRMYLDKNEFEGAKTALATINAAVEAGKKCEGCAAAMLTDGTCAKCKASFKDGKKSG